MAIVFSRHPIMLYMMTDMIDWSQCPLVQQNPDYVSGQAALRTDPRMTVDPLVACADDGMEPEEISQLYNVPIATVQTLLEYAAAHRVTPHPV